MEQISQQHEEALALAELLAALAWVAANEGAIKFTRDPGGNTLVTVAAQVPTTPGFKEPMVATSISIEAAVSALVERRQAANQDPAKNAGTGGFLFVGAEAHKMLDEITAVVNSGQANEPMREALKTSLLDEAAERRSRPTRGAIIEED